MDMIWVEAEKRGREREREKERILFTQQRFLSPSLHCPSTLLSERFICGIHRLEHDTKETPARLDTILIIKGYRFVIALCKAEIAKPRNTIQEIE